MRPLPRILLNAVVALSVVLCTATIVLWPLGKVFHRNPMGLAIAVRQVPRFNENAGFQLIVGVYENNSRDELWYFTGVLPFLGEMDAVDGSQGLGLLGVRLIAYATNRDDWYFGAGLPFWLILPLSVFGVFGVPRYFRLPPRGLCPHCGYDLRATPDRCPECGAVPPPPPHS